MKTLGEILGTVFLTLGAVIGAGFISGRELLSFFGSENFVAYMPLTAALFFCCFYLVFRAGSGKQSLTDLNKSLFKSPKPFDVAVKISCTLSVAVMLSAIDALTENVNPFGLPVYSVLSLIFLSLISRRGVKGAKLVNSIAMPIVIVLVNFIILFNGNITLPKTNIPTPKGLSKAFLYVSMNIFMNLPSFVDGARYKSKKTLVLVSLISSALLVIEATLILGVINGYGKDISTYPLPFFTALGGEKSALILAVICLVAVFTSLTTAYYPLYGWAVKKSKSFGGICLAIGSFALSRLGIKNLVDYAYPIIGGFGVVYVLYCFIFVRYKNFQFAENENIPDRNKRRKVNVSKRKKKNKVVKLSDEQYNNYIMSLKDEVPPKLVRDALEDKN